MYFKTLKEKCEYYRSLADYKLVPNTYVLAMVDGHCFSKVIKNKFEKPFDDTFIKMMNETAKYLCENIQGAKFAYAQSDEISILITDFDTPMTDSFFSFRLCKMQSLIAAMATAKFNQLYYKYVIDMKEPPLCTFDCKVWTVPNANDAYAWFLYRQTDCIKNSKAQTAQTYIPHKDLVRLTADEMIAKLKDDKGIDWNTFENGKKYGRVIRKVDTEMEKDLPNGRHVEFVRSIWTPVDAIDLKENGEWLRELIPGYYED
jgi:tRNA(His) 5'-end guanylyltransferase